MTVGDRAARLAELSERDQKIVRAFIEHPRLVEKELADKVLAMNENTLAHRRKRIFAVLRVGSRLELYALYHVLIADCGCPGHSEG